VSDSITAPLVYVVEDELKLARLVEDYLIAAGYRTQVFYDGLSAFNAIKQQPPAMVLLDLMLPEMDGIEVARKTREFSNVPIIMVTAKVEEVDRLLGLEIGADDYVCKPFSPKELVARVSAVLRRFNFAASDQSQEVQSRLVELDEQKMHAQVDGSLLDLTALEFQLLNTMVSEPGRIFSRQQLMDQIYSDHRVVSDRTIDSHVKKLRKKISIAYPKDELIHSVYGVGYKYEDVG
jgi:two-component system response regulator BaeR